MVNKVFYITGEKIFDVGFRPALQGLEDEFDIKAHASNERRENRVRVVATGSSKNIKSFYEYVRDNDIRVKKQESPYQLSDIKQYRGTVDWNDLRIKSVSEQLYKGFDKANSNLGNINGKLSLIDTKLDTMDSKFGSIRETLQQIYKKLPEHST
jgi:acylphosphatase